MATKAPTLFETATAAVNHYRQYGFDSQAQLDQWVAKIRRAALLQLQTPEQTERYLKQALTQKYGALVNRGGILRDMPELKRVNIDRVKPKLRAELDRRILASANLIKLNRAEAMDKTLRRFQGWATSIPPGGSRAVDVKGEKDDIRKAITSMGFIERRVVIDQSHKLVATVKNIVAVENGALAAEWHSPWRRPGYDYREDHKERDERLYLIRDSWAHQKGLVKPGAAGYYDEITSAGQEPFCSCTVRYVFALRKLPPDMLTKAGMFALPPS